MNMLQQYKKLRNQVGNDCLLVIRMGDFYELFYEDAKTAARVLGLTLTSRGMKNDPDSTPMAGFPYYQLDGYVAKLCNEGFPVAVVSAELGITEHLPNGPIERAFETLAKDCSCGQQVELLWNWADHSDRSDYLFDVLRINCQWAYDDPRDTSTLNREAVKQ